MENFQASGTLSKLVAQGREKTNYYTFANQGRWRGDENLDEGK